MSATKVKTKATKKGFSKFKENHVQNYLNAKDVFRGWRISQIEDQILKSGKFGTIS